MKILLIVVLALSIQTLAQDVPPTVGTIRGCTDMGAYYLCSNVFVDGPHVQYDIMDTDTNVRGCPTVDPQLMNECRDTWETSPHNCCWCYEGGNRCLLRARRANLYFVPKAIAAIQAEPHFRDWRGKSWDYQGVDDHTLVEVGDYRIDVKLSPCSDKARVTCITEVAFVEVSTRKTVQFIANQAQFFGCGSDRYVKDGDVYQNGGLFINAELRDNSIAKYQVNSSTLGAKVTIEKEDIDIVLTARSGFNNSMVKGGLITGTRKENFKNWNPHNNKSDDRTIRIKAKEAFEVGLSWRLKPNESFICSTKTNPYRYDKEFEVPKSRVGDIVTNKDRLEFFECCNMLLCSPEGFDECVMDHMELESGKGPKKCLDGYREEAKVTCNRVQPNGNCKGGWTTWGSCVGRKQSRRYIIEKKEIPGFDGCVRRHGEIETRSC